MDAIQKDTIKRERKGLIMRPMVSIFMSGFIRAPLAAFLKFLKSVSALGPQEDLHWRLKTGESRIADGSHTIWFPGPI